LVEWITSFGDNRYVALLLLNLILLFLGLFFSVTTNLIMTVPLFMPVPHSLAIHPVHFGVIVAINLMIGCVTPPVGTPMHIACSIANISMVKFAKANMPYYLALLATLITVTLWPDLSLWLPGLFGMAR